MICTKNVPVSRSFQGICDSSSLAPSQSSGSRAPAVFMNRLHEHNGLCRFCSSFPDVTLFLSRGRVVHPSSGASHTPTFQAPVSPRCPSRCFISPPQGRFRHINRESKRPGEPQAPAEPGWRMPSRGREVIWGLSALGVWKGNQNLGDSGTISGRSGSLELRARLRQLWDGRGRCRLRPGKMPTE